MTNRSHKTPSYGSLLILALSGFVTSFGAHIVATNLPSYAEKVGVGAFMIGLLIAVYDFAELFAKPLAGFVADKKGMKPSLIVGLLVFVLGSLLFLIISPRLLLVVRFIQGLGAAALSTVSITLVATYFSQERGKAFGIYNAIKGAGYVIAPALGGFLVHKAGFPMIFIVSATVGGLALVLSFFLPSDPLRGRTLEEEENELSLEQFFRIFMERRLLPIYAVIFINMFLVGILFGFLPVYLHSIGYSALRSGTVLSIGTFSYLLVQPFAGYLADKVAIHLTVMVGLLVAALAIAALTFSTGLLLLAIVVLAGLGIGTVWTNSDALIGGLIEKNRMGSGMGAAQSFKELGDMVGPLLIGLITQYFGVRAGFVGCGTAALIALIALTRMLEQHSTRGLSHAVHSRR